MLKKLQIENVLFLDIETVPLFENYDQMSVNMQKLWDKKSTQFRTQEQAGADVYQRAGIYAEFGRIVCISIGVIKWINNVKTFRLKSFASEDETELLEGFCKLLNEKFSYNNTLLCAHNGKEFDFPYIARRCLIKGIELPNLLDIAGKKPWDIMHLDTMELWKFGDYKNYTSLNLLTEIFDIPTPKDDIDGSMVADVFYKENDLERIVTYCQKDVLAIAQLLLRFKGDSLIETENVSIAPF